MSKIRKSAKGKQCQVRIDPCSCGSSETTVLAHLNGAGMGIKKYDFQGAFSCDRCHKILDGEAHTRYSKKDIKLMFYDAVIRTQEILLADGLIVTEEKPRKSITF